MKHVYRLTYDSGAGITIWERPLSELLAPNGEDNLLTWMLKETDQRDGTFRLEKLAISEDGNWTQVL